MMIALGVIAGLGVFGVGVFLGCMVIYGLLRFTDGPGGWRVCIYFAGSFSVGIPLMAAGAAAGIATAMWISSL